MKFTAYLDIPVSSFEFGDAFISNSTDLTVGFSASIANGIVVFLPRFSFTETNNAKFMGVLLQIAKKYLGSEAMSPPPTWTDIFSVPGTNALNEKIGDIERKISEIELQKSEIEKERNDLDEYKFLLYEQGHLLEKKVVDTLRLIGFNAETVPSENTDFDVVLESEEGCAIAEVEGKDNDSVHKGKIDQLISAINQDADQRDTFAKGVLIGNHYRLKPLDQRDEPFTKTVFNLAKQYQYALITTADLYSVAVYFLQNPEDEESKTACRKAIFDANGVVVKFPIPERKSEE